MEIDHVQPEQQVLAEPPRGDFGLQVAIAGGDQTDVDLDRPAAADAIDLALLDRAQQLGLQARVHLADLVEQQRAAARLLELADPPRARPGEGALLVTEQLGLQEVLGNRRAVDRDEGAPCPPALPVQITGDHLLARAAFAGDQDTCFGRRDLPGDAEQLVHRRILEHQPLPVVADRSEDRGDQLRLGGQRQELPGARFDRSDRGARVGAYAVGDHRQEDPLGRERPDQPGDVGRDIDQDQIRAPAGAQLVEGDVWRWDVTQRRPPLHGHLDGSDDLMAARADDQDPHRSCSQACRLPVRTGAIGSSSITSRS